jgi:eukaryotic-like serine/threonine-protein kinase
MRRRSRPEAKPTPRPSRPSWELEEGDPVAPGRIALRRLGGSGLYETYLVWDDRLFAIAVAKLVRPHKVEDERALAAIGREAEALNRLSHPLLVRSFEAVLDGPRPHLLLEHLEGPPLRALIKRHAPLPLEQVLPLAADLCSVLHYMAAEGMVHLDVKPANVIMAAAPKLVDLSVAHSIENAAQLREPVGTLEYMAPEQHDPEGAGPVGPAADIWGVGVTVYEALEGRRPFPPRDGRLPDLDAGPPAFSADVPPEVRDIVLGCLQLRPQDRPRASELAMSLAPIVEAIGKHRVVRRGRPKWR